MLKTLGKLSEVAALFFLQLIKLSFLNNHSAVEDNNSVTFLYCAQSVSNHNGCSVSHHVVQSDLHLLLAFLVECRGGFIQNQDLGLAYNGSCYGYTLLLPTRELAALEATIDLEPIGEFNILQRS